MTVRLALEYAYSKGPIVAAAGNSGYKTDHPFPPEPLDLPMYPACYNWVLGVEATVPSGSNAWFSNNDPTGPVISDSRPYNNIFWNDNEYNYEMRAPGVSILSTVPNGQYRWFQGTSMASGCCMAEPWPMAKASGSKARIAASVVMAMGRMRFLPA